MTTTKKVSFATTEIAFSPVTMKHPQLGEKVANSQAEHDTFASLGFVAPSAPPSGQQTARAVAPPLRPNLSKEDRKRIQEKNQSGSLVIPEKFRVHNLAKPCKIIAFPEKFSARTGNTYAACQVEVEGTKFCILDPGEAFDTGMSATITFFTSENPNIRSGFECTVSL